MQINIPLIISLLSVGPLLVSAGKAPKNKRNPKKVVAIADFPFGFDKNMKGNIVFTAKKGKVVNVHVDMTGLPKGGGPFQYHIHEYSVPGDGNCELVGAHFNPYDAPPDCDNQKSNSYCQVGDLSGKHGWIDATCFETRYNDPYLSLNKKSKSYIVGKSITFHYANLTKFACADIELASEDRLRSLEVEYSANSYDDLQDLKEVLAESYDSDSDYDYDYDSDSGSGSGSGSGPDSDSDSEDEDEDNSEDSDSEGVSTSYEDSEVDQVEALSRLVKLQVSPNGRSNIGFVSSYNGTDIDDNHSNQSNVSVNFHTTKFENGSPLKTFGLSAGLAGLIGLLI